MFMKPQFVLNANGKDISQSLMDRVVSVKVCQKSGLASDTCTIEIDDHRQNPIQLPGDEDTIAIALGYAQETTDDTSQLINFGQFDVSEFSLNGTRDSLTIFGNKSLWSKGLQIPVKFSWLSEPEKPLLLKSVVDKIAGKYGLKAKLSPKLNTIELPAIEQNESDMQLLTRLGSYFDAIVKIVEDFLVFIPRGTGKTTSGRALKEVTLVREQLLSWTALNSQYPGYKSCQAWYHDFISASRKKVEVGSGKPCFDLNFTYADEATAKLAANARLTHANRMAKSIDLKFIGEPNVMAGGIIKVEGVRNGIDGKWFVSQVEHLIDSRGFVSQAQCVLLS
ncbi:phage late control D family protein [Pseudoalteromonas denitrificans]|uniref:Phage protein D n=1 Tax=Pseudoalteromonas denitrificans DSM 6059 TaxID=1123010 RepID=A0A1I1QGT9_9GAMM|nr:hypothetical protein [Pseudoalteromonas denitrificans]SFD17330.1 hypothetical protein SAMN02745724_03751 [Pseudoalteromonas denitrificans DSM 6059]